MKKVNLNTLKKLIKKYYITNIERSQQIYFDYKSNGGKCSLQQITKSVNR